jgi:hypothetical protein
MENVTDSMTSVSLQDRAKLTARAAMDVETPVIVRPTFSEIPSCSDHVNNLVAFYSESLSTHLDCIYVAGDAVGDLSGSNRVIECNILSQDRPEVRDADA